MLAKSMVGGIDRRIDPHADRDRARGAKERDIHRIADPIQRQDLAPGGIAGGLGITEGGAVVCACGVLEVAIELVMGNQAVRTRIDRHDQLARLRIQADVVDVQHAGRRRRRRPRWPAS